jgi:two-component system chemotaxis response regulator CheY
MDEMRELIDDFVSDCFELLEAAEGDLLDLEENPEQEIINRIFRSFHSVKGSAAMLGFSATSEFAHHVEDLFMDVRSGKVAITKPIADQLLTGIDALKEGIELLGRDGEDIFDYAPAKATMDSGGESAPEPESAHEPEPVPEAKPEPVPAPEQKAAPKPAPKAAPTTAPRPRPRAPRPTDKSLPPTPPAPTTSDITKMLQGEIKDVSIYSQKGGHIKCLVVDDDFTARMILSTYLSRFGLCHVAKDGAEAVEAVRKSYEGEGPEPYDLICLDIMMPIMDGITATRIMRDVEAEKAADISSENPFREAVILITSAIDDEKIAFKAVYESGANSYFTKPLSFKDIHRQLVLSGLLPVGK